MTRTAIVHYAFGSYAERPQSEQVRITRSKARAAGPDGVTFYAPGWRPMVFRSMDAAVRKIESHPGFEGWVA